MKKIRVAINGFGRIGRQVFRALHERYKDKIEVVAINDLSSIQTCVHLLEYDSSYGQSLFSPTISGDRIIVDKWSVRALAERDPKKLPWKELEVDIVVEATGIFRTAPEAGVHIDNGARKVIITAPAKDEDITIVLGVNENDYDPAKHHIVSNASCTTNCLAPVALVMQKEFGIKIGTMTTIHSYTNDQCVLDGPHKDLRRARTAAVNIIPTSTGAAQAVAKVIPALKGKFTGYSLRVPTPTVSLIDFVAVLEKPTDTATLIAKLKAAADGPLKGIMAISELPLVSMDFKGNPHSSIVDAEYCQVQDGTLAKIVSWYDNEWGYSCRVTDLIDLMGRKGL